MLLSLLFIQILLAIFTEEGSQKLQTKQTYPLPNFFALATIDSVYDGQMSLAEFQNQEEILLLTEHTDLQIISYKVLGCGNQSYLGKLIPDSLKIRAAGCYRSIFFYNIVAVSGDKDTFQLNNIRLVVGKKLKKTKPYISEYIRTPYFVYRSDLFFFGDFDKLLMYRIIEPSNNLTIIYFETFWEYGEGFNDNIKSHSCYLNSKQKGLLNRLGRSDIVSFSKISAVTPDCDTILLPPMVFFKELDKFGP